jgi:hypothetical protein
MWAAWVVAAIALVAVTFMLRFLIALLREGSRSSCYRAVPIRKEPGKQLHLINPSGNADFDDDRCATEWNRGDYHLEFLENQCHVKENYSSDLIVLDVRLASAPMVWRSIYPGRGGIRQGHGL